MMIIKLGYCTLLTFELGKIKFVNGRSCGYEEGSQISFYYRDNGNESIHIATCMKNGSWIPDPHTYKCDTAEFEVTSKAEVLPLQCPEYHNMYSVLAYKLQCQYDYNYR